MIEFKSHNRGDSMNEPVTKTVHLFEGHERLSVNIYSAENEVFVRETQNSIIWHMYDAWRLLDGIGVCPGADKYSAFDLAGPEHMRCIIRANAGWPYSLERRDGGLPTHETLKMTTMRNTYLASVLSGCEETGQAVYEGITEIHKGEETLYRRICLPVMGRSGKVEGIYIVFRPLRGEYLPAPRMEVHDATC